MNLMNSADVKEGQPFKRLKRRLILFSLLHLAVVLDILTVLDKYNILTLWVRLKRKTEIVESDNTIVTALPKYFHDLHALPDISSSALNL